MPRTFGLIGAPSSVGAHWPGQEKAPGCLRAAGLVEELTGAGLDVVDMGDLPVVRFAPHPVERRPHNLSAVVQFARDLAGRVQTVLRAGHLPLVIGGDCSITVGVLSAFLHKQENLALLYMDGGVDLYTPETEPPGILDSMGVAHMLGEPGTAEAFSRIGPRFPLLSPGSIVFFAPDMQSTQQPERAVCERHQMAVYPAARVHGSAGRLSAQALADVEGRGEQFLIHFDVDSIDFLDFPISDVPLINAGITFAEAMQSLSVFTASPKFAGLVITEFNPDHADEKGVLAKRFVKGLANALSGISA